MKRSEMVDAMVGQLIELFPNETADTLREDMEEKMSALLAFMEYRGMKPPVTHTDPILYSVKHVWEREEDVKS